MHDRLATGEILRRDPAQILVDRARTEVHHTVLAVEPPVAVIAGVIARHLVALGQEQGNEPCADVTFTAGDENSHFRLSRWVSDPSGRVWAVITHAQCSIAGDVDFVSHGWRAHNASQPRPGR